MTEASPKEQRYGERKEHSQNVCHRQVSREVDWVPCIPRLVEKLHSLAKTQKHAARTLVVFNRLRISAARFRERSSN